MKILSCEQIYFCPQVYDGKFTEIAQNHIIFKKIYITLWYILMTKQVGRFFVGKNIHKEASIFLGVVWVGS